MTPRKKRPLATSARTALELIADAGERRIPRWDFHLRMSQRGANGRDLLNAMSTLARRDWVHSAGAYLIVTEAGWLAATTGEGVVPPRKITRLTGLQRMPPGLF